MLLVKIISLNSKVKDQDWFSKNDLYIELVYGDQIHRTTVKWNNDNPKWNETFLFDYVENQKMKFELYDQNVWSPGKKLVHLHRFVPEMGEIKYTTQGIFNIQIFSNKNYTYYPFFKKISNFTFILKIIFIVNGMKYIKVIMLNLYFLWKTLR